MRKIISVCVAAFLLLSSCGMRPEEVEDTPPAVTESPGPQAPESAAPAPVTTAAATDPPPAVTEPAAAVETPPTLPPIVTDAPPAPPETPEATAPPGPDAAFADAAFLGNSLVDGLRRFGGLEQGQFFAMDSASVINVGKSKTTFLSDGGEATLLEALCEGEYGKVYVLLGINEISFAPDYFVRLYGGVLDAVVEGEPGAEIYVMSLTPVTKAKNDEGSYFTMEAVEAYNDALRALAEERGFHYIDLVDALAGEDGFLPEENSTDGIHLTREAYPVWAEYLRTHI